MQTLARLNKRGKILASSGLYFLLLDSEFRLSNFAFQVSAYQLCIVPSSFRLIGKYARL